MTKQEQQEFIIALIENVKTEILQKSLSKIPENWEGRELRQYIADTFQKSAWIQMDRKRKTEYNNDILINNL